MGESIALEIIVKFKCWRPLELQQSRILRAEYIWILWARRNLQSERTLNVSIIHFSCHLYTKKLRGRFTVIVVSYIRQKPIGLGLVVQKAILLKLMFKCCCFKWPQKKKKKIMSLTSTKQYQFSIFYLRERHKNISRYI